MGAIVGFYESGWVYSTKLFTALGSACTLCMSELDPLARYKRSHSPKRRQHDHYQHRDTRATGYNEATRCRGREE